MNKLILTFFYSGLAKKAPGTFGSIAAVFFWIFLNQFTTSNIFWLGFLSIIFIYGIIFIKYYAKIVGQIDHKSIVLDEVLGQILTLELTFIVFNLDKSLLNYHNMMIIILSLIAFRFFDIIKIFPINIIDQKMKHPFGVMFDDFIAGIFAFISLFFIYKII